MINVRIRDTAKYIYAYWLKYTKRVKIKTVFVETTSKCNLQCKNCYRTDNSYSSKNNDMNLQLFKKIIDVLPSKINSLIPQGIGEPMINPQLLEMVKYASISNKFKNILFNTNLTVNTDQITNLFNNGLTAIWVSVDSFNQKTLDVIKKGTCSKVLYNNLCQLGKRYSNRVYVRIVASKTNISELGETIIRIKQAGVKRIEIQPLIDFKNNGSALSTNDRNEVLRIINEHSKKCRINFHNTSNLCTQPYDTVCVNVNGMVMPCCHWFNEDVVNLGNIRNGFLNSYYSDEFNLIRSSFFVNKPEFCNSCPDYRKI